MLLRIMAENDRIPFSRWHVALIYILKTLFMFPLSLSERIFLTRKIQTTTIQQTPVFIIGHYRSGTTFLHKVLASDKRWGGINTFNFLFPYFTSSMEKFLKPLLQGIINTFKIKHLHFHNYIFNLDDPLEEDMITLSSVTPNSAFWSEIFPKNALKHFDQQIFFKTIREKEEWKEAYLYCLQKLTLKHKGKRLLLKNPPNTGRILALLELFPDAKFVFIYRNPYQVYYSTQNLWKRTLEKYYTLHKITDTEREKIIFTHYFKLMSKYEKDKELIPRENLAEIRYETFEKDPFAEIKRIYEELDLPDFEIVAGDIKNALDKEKKYSKYKYDYDEKTQDKIYEHWGYFINKWNYVRLTKSPSRVLQN